MVGIFLIGTGKYIDFVKPLVSDINKYFLVGHQKTIYVFTDSDKDIPGVVKIYQEHKPWPYSTLFRSNIITDYTDENNINLDYYYYIDVDVRIVDYVNEEILGDFVVVQHCGFFKKRKELWAMDRNFLSAAYCPWHKIKYYVGGGFNGGKRYLEVQHEIRRRLERDQKYNFIPAWNDESYLNSVCCTFMEPDVVLDPSYHYPDNEYDVKQWGLRDIKPKILLLYKDKSYTTSR
jgi:hypothetical protein